MHCSLSQLPQVPERVAQFTTTHWSVVQAAPESASALETLCCTYWYPLYAYVRRRGRSPEEAEDLTQEFFARLLAGKDLSGVDRAKGKFRSFLLAALNHFLANEWDRATAAKRGGNHVLISLDDDNAEERYRMEPAVEVTPEKGDWRRRLCFGCGTAQHQHGGRGRCCPSNASPVPRTRASRDRANRDNTSGTRRRNSPPARCTRLTLLVL